MWERLACRNRWPQMDHTFLKSVIESLNTTVSPLLSLNNRLLLDRSKIKKLELADNHRLLHLCALEVTWRTLPKMAIILHARLPEGTYKLEKCLPTFQSIVLTLTPCADMLTAFNTLHRNNRLENPLKSSDIKWKGFKLLLLSLTQMKLRWVYHASSLKKYPLKKLSTPKW